MQTFIHQTRSTEHCFFNTYLRTPSRLTTHTTGKLYFAECFLSGHSAKQYFAECRTRQRWLCRVPTWLSAKVPLGKRWPARDGGHLPSDFAECLTASTRQIFFIFKNLFCRVPAPGTRQFFKKKHILPSASPWHSTIFFYFLKLILPSAIVRHSAIFF